MHLGTQSVPPALLCPSYCFHSLKDYFKHILLKENMANNEYLTQDFAWNADDGQYDLTMHSDMLPLHLAAPLMQSLRYEQDGENVMVAILSIPQITMILHCKCKQGSPAGELVVAIETAARIKLHWPGVSRVFVRVRIMESTAAETMLLMLLDDVEGGHSKSDTESPDVNQSSRPWSDQEDSDTETLGDES